MATFKKSGVNIMVTGADRTKYVLICPCTSPALFSVVLAFGADPTDLNDEGLRAEPMYGWPLNSAKSVAASFVDGTALDRRSAGRKPGIPRGTCSQRGTNRRA